MPLVVCEDSVLWEDAVALLWPAWDAAGADSEDVAELVPFCRRGTYKKSASQEEGARWERHEP